MAVFGGLVLTNVGRNLEAKIIGQGKKLTFKNVQLGDEELGSSENLYTLSALKNKKLDLDINNIKIVNDNTVRISFELSNTTLQEGFYWREIGIIAIDPDTQAEILYAYGNARDNGEYIPPSGTTDILEKYINLDIIISNTKNVEVTIDKSMVYVTQDELDELKEKLQNQIIVSEEDPEQEECIWYQIVKSKSVSSSIAEIMVEVADEYDANSTYQLETITNMTSDENDQNKIIEREE